MQLQHYLTAAGLALAGFTAALPTEDINFYNFLNKRALTPDNTCGNTFNGANKGYSCDPVLEGGGGCCSQYGFCGNTTDYCGIGCQPEFGDCSGSETTPQDPNLCGPSNNNNRCLSGLCCSGSGYCGNTTDYCEPSNGCQSGFGDCTATVGGNGDGTCGPAFGNAKCPSGQCCSSAGYCGTTKEHCADPDCQYPFGTCDSNTTPAGASTKNDPRPKIGSVSYSDDIYNCIQANVVALTYDDGPYDYTTQLLDVLGQFGFKATFFMTGNNIGKGSIDTTEPYPTIIRRMIAEGHQVASHTWSHYSLDKIGRDLRIDQMTKNERAIANIIGKYPTYMRPPFSQCSAASGCAADMEALGYHRISFDLDTQDYLNPLPTQVQNSKDIVQAALAGSAGDYLAIQHDIVEQSVTNLTSFFFQQIKNKGWKGVTAGECLGDPESNWYRAPGGGDLSVSPSSSTTASSGTLSTTLSTNATVSGSISSQSSTSVSATATTSGVSSTTSSPSPTVTTTSSLTISLKPTSTQSSTSIAVPPAATCAVQAGKFCGKVLSFGDKKGCFKSAGDCYLQNAECYMKAGYKNFEECKRWSKVCNKLTLYCTTCGFQCASTKFEA